MWDWDYAWRIFPSIAKALQITVLIAILSFGIALFLGLALFLLRRSRVNIIRWSTIALIETIRGTPLLVQLLFGYLALPEIGVTIDPRLLGVLILGLHYASYMSEAYRGAFEAVSRGQWDAACGLSLSDSQTWRYVVLPQMIPALTPVSGGYLILLFKEVPVLSVITVNEILREAMTFGTQSFRYIEPLTIVGVLFLIVSLVSARFVTSVERRVRYAH